VKEKQTCTLFGDDNIIANWAITHKAVGYGLRHGATRPYRPSSGCTRPCVLNNTLNAFRHIVIEPNGLLLNQPSVTAVIARGERIIVAATVRLFGSAYKLILT